MSTADVQLPVSPPQASSYMPVSAPALHHDGRPKFDPARHLKYVPPAKRHTFTELGLNSVTPPTDVCITDPFGLFTEECVRLMRRELFQPAVFNGYMHSWARAPCVVRGIAPTVSQFIYDAWMHPATLEAISNAAGIDLVPVMDWEIAHTNIQVGSKGLSGVRELGETPTPALSTEEVASMDVENNNKLVDDWHVDSYQFVCVVMLSDTSTMRGGETAIETANGEVLKMRAAHMGGGVVLQGGITKHAAFRTIGASERVTMVTSFRPKSLALRDNSTLRNITNATSDMNEVHYQFAHYRLKLVRDRVDEFLDRLTERKRNLAEGQEILERKELNGWVEQQVEHLQNTVYEMFDRVKDTW